MNRNVTEPAGKAAEAPLRSLRDLRGLTQARIALGAHGSGVPTQAALAFNFDHARAREALDHLADRGVLAADDVHVSHP